MQEKNGPLGLLHSDFSHLSYVVMPHSQLTPLNRDQLEILVLRLTFKFREIKMLFKYLTLSQCKF